LRDDVDIQTHELNQLKARNRDLTEDLDRRLRALEQHPGADAPIPAPDPAANKSVTEEQQKEYDAAFDLMKQGYYERSIKAFREFNARHAGNGLADNAQYWIAEGTYVQRHYKQALDEFNKMISGYPQSQKQPDALLKIGYTHYELGANDKARKALNDVLAKFPDTPAAKLAAARLDKMKKEGR
jgi:tol-pal system protein YbgF